MSLSNGPQATDAKKEQHPDTVTAAPVAASTDVTLTASPALTPGLQAKRNSDPSLKQTAGATAAAPEEAAPAAKTKACCTML